MIKFEDDNPAEKYTLVQNWQNEDATLLISQREYDAIWEAQVKKVTFVKLSNGTLVNINDIKRIQRSHRWQSAEEKREEAKNSHISDLWWDFKHAIQEDRVDKNMTFEVYLKTVLKKTDETVEKIRKQARKSGAGIEI